MSLIFKPKIPEGYVRGTPTKSTRLKAPKTNRKPWSPEDIQRLEQLRVLGVSYSDIGKLLKRSPATCTWMVHDLDLGLSIANLRAMVIDEVMYPVSAKELAKVFWDNPEAVRDTNREEGVK